MARMPFDSILQSPDASLLVRNLSNHWKSRWSSSMHRTMEMRHPFEKLEHISVFDIHTLVKKHEFHEGSRLAKTEFEDKDVSLL